jgi:hypothetical protein
MEDIKHIITEHHIQSAMRIKIETLKSEYQRVAETDVFRTGDTAYKQKLTPHTAYKCLYVVLPY